MVITYKELIMAAILGIILVGYVAAFFYRLGALSTIRDIRADGYDVIFMPWLRPGHHRFIIRKFIDLKEVAIKYGCHSEEQ